ncbi:hypothetical protein ABPG74_006704 [Tetrahymena malaccensis]
MQEIDDQEYAGIIYYIPACEVDEYLLTHLVKIDGVYKSQSQVIDGQDILNGDFCLRVVVHKRSEIVLGEFIELNLSTNYCNLCLNTGVLKDSFQSYNTLLSINIYTL